MIKSLGGLSRRWPRDGRVSVDEQPLRVRLTFDQLTRGEANRAVEELRRAILGRSSGISASIEKTDAESQDAGTTLALLFGSSASLVIAHGIRAYLARWTDERYRITIRTAGGTEIVASGEAARALDVAELVRTLERGRTPRNVILFLAARPSNTSPLALDRECAAIERELRASQHRDDFEFRSKWAVTVDDLARCLMELRPAIVHVSGHGVGQASALAQGAGYGRDVADAGAGGGGILLHDAANGSQLVTARALAMLIRSATDSVRLVVLNACYSEAQAEMLRSVVDCVVGMAGVIHDDAARAFAVGLYRALGHRRSVGHAVEHAVATLAAKQLPDEQLPRLRTRDGIDANQLVLGASV